MRTTAANMFDDFDPFEFPFAAPPAKKEQDVGPVGRVPKSIGGELADLNSPIWQYRNTKPIYNGETILRKWVDSDTGRWIRFALADEPSDKVNPCKGMNCGKSNGQRMKLVVTEPAGVDDEDGGVVFMGEVVLMRWADNNTEGMTIQFMMDDGPDGGNYHPFRALRAGKEGERLHVVCWAVDDDENLQQPENVRRKVPFHLLPPVKQAGILCGHQQFRRWLADNVVALIEDQEMRAGLPPVNIEGTPPKEYAEAFVRMYCGVASRSELGADTVRGSAARSRWQELTSMYNDEVWGRV